MAKCIAGPIFIWSIWGCTVLICGASCFYILMDRSRPRLSSTATLSTTLWPRFPWIKTTTTKIPSTSFACQCKTEQPTLKEQKTYLNIHLQQKKDYSSSNKTNECNTKKKNFSSKFSSIDTFLCIHDWSSYRNCFEERLDKKFPITLISCVYMMFSY